ncbi:uncharacterized protein J8A68_002072 [[Candida] subhashii]|uniref:FAD-binding FR-type domain-containing protein n=1 Tax=[Candida] subhashii TaxID=561895 RepID=A0A8J5V1Q6_9ASCO|nr:uncharacterized protein J8A68_002072 [[Candida] subhashii]KAG7664399.1 hypothetical protein J8A68_002072 [[Candida] subhashii]
MLLLFLVFIIVDVRLCYVETADIDYLVRYYVVSKRVARVAMGNIPAVYLTVTKNDFVTAITGLSNDMSLSLHYWFSRLIFIMITIHAGYGIYYWQFDIKSPKMLDIPPQYFGYIAYASFFFLVFANIKIIRQFAFDFFMVHHRIHSFIMLLFAFFHNGGNKAMVILGVHLLVADRIIGRVMGIIQKRTSPTKGWSEFEILDEETMSVSIPIRISHRMDMEAWYNTIIPKKGNWRAGSYVLLNVGKISLFQYHPFTIASLPESGTMVLIIKKKNGFTKKLYNKVLEIKQKQLEEWDETEEDDKNEKGKVDIDISQEPSSGSSNGTTADRDSYTDIDSRTHLEAQDDEPEYKKVTNPNIVKLKAGINGPFFAKYHPYITFDSIAFISMGVGSSFTLPIVLDLLQTIESRNLENDFIGRPLNSYIHVYLSFRWLQNISWYADLFEKLLPFINEGKLFVDIHITRTDSLSTITRELTRNTYDDHSHKFAEKLVSSSINFTFGCRLDLDSIIQRHVSLLSVPEDMTYKSLGVAICGVEEFGKEVEVACDKRRWGKDVPNIYVYNETF